MSLTLPAFTAPGRFWRGNLHTRSTRSDGVLEPAEVIRRYKAEGYDFIALTDHFVGHFGYPIVDTTPFRDDSFTTILGAELHSGAMENGELWHILAVGLPPDFAPSNTPSFIPVADQETGPEIAARAVAAGAFVAVAHPQWSSLTFEDARSITAAHAVEIYNHGCAMGCDRADGFMVADQLLTEGRKLTLIATDDAHFSEPDHFGGWVMVSTPSASKVVPKVHATPNSTMALANDPSRKYLSAASWLSSRRRRAKPHIRYSGSERTSSPTNIVMRSSSGSLSRAI